MVWFQYLIHHWWCHRFGHLNSDDESFASWLKRDGNGAIKFAIFIYWFIWDKQKYPINFEVVGTFILSHLRLCALSIYTCTRISTDIIATMKTLTDLILIDSGGNNLVTRPWLPWLWTAWSMVLVRLVSAFCFVSLFVSRPSFVSRLSVLLV